MNDREVDMGLIPKSLFSTTTLKPKGLTNHAGESSNSKRSGNFYSAEHSSATNSPEMNQNSYETFARKRHKSVGAVEQEIVGNKSWTASKYVSSDSTSDDSTSSDSDSEETELPAHSLNALKTQKEMHELLLKLERTRSKHARYLEKAKSEAKKIQKISRKLQQKFHAACEQVSVWSQNMQTSGVGNNPNGTNKISPQRGVASSRYPNNLHSSSVQSPPLLHHPLDSLVVASPSKPTYKPNGASMQKQESEYDVNSEMLDVISRTRTDMRTKAFTRKPRSLIYQVAKDYEGKEMECLVTSSLDGEIQFWSPTMRKIVTRVTKQTLKKPWAEDICFVHPSIVAVASAKKDGEFLENQVSFVHLLKANTSQISYRVQHSNSKPHSDRGVSALCPIVSNDQEFMFSTCGSDKMVHLWKYKTPQNGGDDAEQTGLLLAHSRHTSAVHALCYEPEQRVLYSGGADCKFYGYSLETKNIVTEYKYAERVNHVITHPTNPDLLLVCLSGKSEQLHIYDRRTDNFSSLTFGFQQSDNLSRYMSPSFHSNGHLVAFGQNEPKINIWDIRYIQQGRKSSQVLYLHERRILKTLFHPHQDTLISMSTDSSLAFTDFHMFENTVVV